MTTDREDAGASRLRRPMRVAAVAGPLLWVIVGPAPTVWGVLLVSRYEDQGFPLALIAGLAATILIEAIALPTLAVSAVNPRSGVLRALALAGHAALVLVALTAWTVFKPQFIGIVNLATLTAVSVASTVGWVRTPRPAPR